MSANNYEHTFVKALPEVEIIVPEIEQYLKKNDASVPGSENSGNDSTVRISEQDESFLKDKNVLKSFIKQKVRINERNFNINEVMGNFPIDKFGQIINQKETVWNNNFRDLDG